MKIDVNEVAHRVTELTELDSDCPDTGAVILLPPRFDAAASDDPLLEASDASTIRKVLKENGVNATQSSLGQSNRLIEVRKSGDWHGPAILIGTQYLLQNPQFAEIVLEIIKSYVSELAVGWARGSRVKFSVVVKSKKSGKYKKIVYDGPASKIAELAAIVEDVTSE